MSYVLAVWPQDILQPWPADRDMAQSQLEQAQAAAPPTTHDPRLLAFAHALDARFPSQGDEDDVYDNLPPDPNRDAPEGWLNIGLYDSAERDAAYAHAVVQANDQGLNLFDPQSGDVFLANGVALGLDSPSQCLRAVDAWHRRDLALARAEYRRVAAGRDDQALQGWGLLLGKGQGGPRNHSLGAALMQLGGADADEDPKGYGLALQRLTPSLQQEQARQHEVLQAAADLLAAVDTEIALQETLLQDALRDITNPRLRKQAALVLIRIANNGHAAAAYRLSLEVAFGKSIAGAQDDADHWLRLAARWGDPAAQVSLARQLMKGLNPALDEAEKWLLQAQASGVRGQESLLADLRTKRDELAALPGRAESGEAAAQRQLAQQLMDPTDPTDPQRVAQGMAWLQRAAEQGDAAAAAELGHALAFGRPGVAPDPLAARPWLDQAVQGGSAHGQAALAQLLAVPGATQSDAARALELAIESAANRSGNGLFLLATFLHAGVGGSRDVVVAKAVMHLAQVVGGELVRQHPDIWPQYQPTPDEHLPVQILRNQINDNLRGMPELLARRGETPAASG